MHKILIGPRGFPNGRELHFVHDPTKGTSALKDPNASRCAPALNFMNQTHLIKHGSHA